VYSTRAMTKIYLVRHGETDWNSERRVLGWSSVPLNSRGVFQAETLAKILPSIRIEKIYTSPLARTLQTAEILGSQLNLTPVKEPRFIEANIGSWEGQYWKDLVKDPIRQKYYTHPKTARPPKGETSFEVQQRTASGIRALCDLHPNGSFLVVSHADLIRCVLCHLLKIDLQIVRHFWINHAALSLVLLEGDEAVLPFLNFFPEKSALDSI